MQDDLRFLYQQLRQQLDEAYAARVWDSARIDHITRDMQALEHGLVAAGVVVVPSSPARRGTMAPVGAPA